MPSNRRSEKAKQYRPLYQTPDWKALAREVREDQGDICSMCGKRNPRLVVDHIKPHRGNLAKFFDRANLQGLCPTPCHNRYKQQQEVRGYHSGVDADGWPTDPAHPFNGT